METRLEPMMKARFVEARTKTHATNKLWAEVTDMLSATLQRPLNPRDIRVRPSANECVFSPKDFLFVVSFTFLFGVQQNLFNYLSREHDDKATRTASATPTGAPVASGAAIMWKWWNIVHPYFEELPQAPSEATSRLHQVCR